MKILLVNGFLKDRTGSEVYLAELAAGLAGRGQEIVLFAPEIGRFAEDLRNQGLVVIDDLLAMPWVPEVIHAQHFRSTALAVLAFSQTPVFWICHGAVPRQEYPLAAPTILRRAAVDRPCQNLVMSALGLPASQVEIIPNAVRLDLFAERASFPEKIRRALIFSNYQRQDASLEIIRAACAAEDILLEVAGSESGRATDLPWKLLPDYDLVFAKGRAALEAMACGCSVILYGVDGVGPAVQAADFVALREWNFGFTLLQAPCSMETIRKRIRRCSAENARDVMRLCRSLADQADLVALLEERYREMMEAPLRTDAAAAWLAFAKSVLHDASPLDHRPGLARPFSGFGAAPYPDSLKVEGLFAAYGVLSQALSEDHAEARGEARAEAFSILHSYSEVFNEEERAALQGFHGQDWEQPVLPPPMPFVVCCPRSGSTWLRLMLDAHPELAMPPETGFIASLAGFLPNQPCFTPHFLHVLRTYPPLHPHFADYGLDLSELAVRVRALKPFTIAGGLRAFYRMYAEKFGKSRCGDKTPSHVNWMPDLERFLPEARFIHLVRDPRGVINSLCRQRFRPEGGVAGAAAFWGAGVQKGRTEGLQRRHYLEVRYEDLVLHKEETLRNICDFIDLPWSGDMLRHQEKAGERLAEIQSVVAAEGGTLVAREDRLKLHQPATESVLYERLHRWQNELSEEDRRTIEVVAGQAMDDFGYLR